MLNEEQKKLLAAPLTASHVKSREMGGRQVRYIEGWHVIAEANRIFGFDAWSREAVDIRCVAEREREVGKQKQPGWGVTYTARVRITVGTVIREGCGSGHGIDRDLGQAHESAIKEAETDAMKRALMTFGNPFGLALYDKEGTNVVEEPDARSACIDASKKIIAGVWVDREALGEWWNSSEQKEARRFAGLSADDVDGLKAIVTTRRDVLPARKGKAA